MILKKSITMITGSTAAGETLPSHFQFLTDVQSPDQMRLQNEIIVFCHRCYSMMQELLQGFPETVMNAWDIGFSA